MSTKNYFEQENAQIYSQFKPILNDYKIIKNLSPSTQEEKLNSEFSNVALRLTTNLHPFLMNIVDKNEFERHDFLSNYNDLIVEIITNTGELLASIPSQFKLNEIKTILINYAVLVLNLAEKSPIKYNHLRNIFNKLIGNILNIIGNIQNGLHNSFIGRCVDESNLLYELYRALGSLIYENGPVLKNQSIDLVLSCVTKLELKVENDINFLLNKKSTFKNQGEISVLYKLKLISTQLVFNMTMAKENINTDNEYREKDFIEDEYKVFCAEFLIRVLRFNMSLKFGEKCGVKDESNIDKSLFCDEEFMANLTKTMVKALYGLDNLFQSINLSSNWINIKNEKFQLGDILAIVKDLCLYGLIPKHNKIGIVDKDNKLEPSNVDDLIQVENKKQQNENDSDPIGAHSENADSVEKKSKKFNNKKLNNNSKFSNRDNEKGKSSKFVRNNSGKQYQTQANQTGSFNSKYNENDNHNLQYLKEAQVPLFNYKNLVNTIGNDSDTSDCSFSSSSFNMEKSKAKVRVSSFGVLLTLFQKLDKRTIVSYWKSFLELGNNNLFYSIKNDPSPKVRLLATTVLTLYLEYVRSFFSIAAADDFTSNLSFQSIPSHQSFLPISFTISNIIRQLYKDIFMCLSREPFQFNQIHLLKCLQQLIKATPYQKLKPGLLYKLILSLNILLDQKNTLLSQSPSIKDKINVLNEILICLNSILANYYSMAEVHLALSSPLKNVNTFLNFGSVRSSTCSSIMEEDDLSENFEKFTNLKVPNINQTRVKYFYESNTTSGHMTPNYNQFCDLSVQESNPNSKSWLVDFCLKNSSASHSISVPCLDLLTTISQYYFDLLKKDLFYENICHLILENLNSSHNPECQNSNQVTLKTIKFTEEFCRCLATNELRQMNSIDLNDCCKLWSSLLNSKLLSEYLFDEQRYLISSSACDCLASIGAPIFELLPHQKRIFCLTNLLHLTKSPSNLIRAASVRALGVYVTFASLKEDQNFLTDLSLCLLNLINNDSNNLVRQKTAWSISNLSEVLIENIDRVGNVFLEEFNLSIWYQLLETTTNACHRESEKLKSYLVRALGNLINYASSADIELMRHQFDLANVEKSISKAVETLCMCKNVKMLKVKWNLSHAIGIAMKRFNNWPLAHKNCQWLQLFYGTLLELFSNSSNFKVRINACIALMSINAGDVNIIRNNANDSIYLKIWYSSIEGFSKLKNENIDACNEIQHKNTLTHQLCKLFTFLSKYLLEEDLEKLMTNGLNQLMVNSIQTRYAPESDKQTKNLTTSELRNYLVEYIKTIYEKIEIHKMEVQLYNEALTNLNFLNCKKKSKVDEECIKLLNGILLKPKEKSNYESESSDAEAFNSDHENTSEYRKKFPFKNVYD